MSTVFWFRRDLRLQDNEGLNEAIARARDVGEEVCAVYWIQPEEFEKLSSIRQNSLSESLLALDDSLNKCLNVVAVKSASEFAQELLKLKTTTVFASELFDPAGITQQNQLKQELGKSSITLELIGSNYAVSPGRVRKPTDATPYRVYTPFYKAWLEVGWPKPFRLPKDVNWAKPKLRQFPKPSSPSPYPIRAGEKYALETFERFKKRALFDYHELRNRADLGGTSKLSFALAHGEIHPRTLLAQLGTTQGHEVFAKELAWREFYADVLFHNPHTTNEYYEPRFKKMRYDTGAKANLRLAAWKRGETGYPMVDAGMRQLLQEGWMHNRVRMIVASFLVKDLHLEWQKGASWFEENLADFDIASNAHGWQWTAGCGTDASPYYRIFNPILQGYKFDPQGDYVRKYIPELRHLTGPEVHEPWKLIDGLVNGYPEPIVDHQTERDESLRRLEEIKEN